MTMTCRHGLVWARFLKFPLAIAFFIGGQEEAGAQSPYQLRSNREWTLLGVGAALGLSGLALIDDIEPFTENELSALNTQDINSFDRSGMEPYREATAGDVMKYASFALPLTLFIDTRTRQDWKTLGVMWGEVLLVEAGFTAITKGLVRRTRPYAYDPDAPLDQRTSTDARVSFYSGHTSVTAATCFYLARVYSDYPMSGTTKTIAWSVAAVYPAVVGLLRVDSGHHFRTDVLTGYLVGAAVGILIPQLHRASGNEDSSIGAAASGGRFALTFNF